MYVRIGGWISSYLEGRGGGGHGVCEEGYDDDAEMRKRMEDEKRE